MTKRWFRRFRKQQSKVADVGFYSGRMDKQTASMLLGEETELQDTIISGEVKVQAYAPPHVKIRFNNLEVNDDSE